MIRYCEAIVIGAVAGVAIVYLVLMFGGDHMVAW
jgi:hypothetical protein